MDSKDVESGPTVSNTSGKCGICCVAAEMQSAVIAEKEILERHGAVVLEIATPSPPLITSPVFAPVPSKGISYRGWNFCSHHALMADENELIKLQSKISARCGAEIRDDDIIVIDGHNLHIPPMLFLQDSLSIEHSPSGYRFDFSAADAICCWAMKHTNPHQLEILEVPYAKKWIEESSGMKQHRWDWTYSSDYNCTISRQRLQDQERQESVIISEGRAEEKSVLLDTSPQSSLLSEPLLQETSPGGIDLELLKAQDDILFFDDFILYQDDLQDCGECQYSVKIRVMPTCWFTLCRLFLRIDGSRILIKDTRIFHDFSSDKIFIEISTRQGQESDYQIPISAVPPASSLQIPGVSSRTNPMSPTSPPAATSPAFRPLSLTGMQLRDSNFMSRILPLHPFKVVAPAEGEGTEATVVMKPQLDFFLQLHK